MDTVAAPRTDFIGLIRRWMVVEGLTQTALAKRLGVTQPYISMILSGVQPVTAEFAKRVLRHKPGPVWVLAAAAAVLSGNGATPEGEQK